MTRINRYTQPHDASPRCHGGHCWIHEVDELAQNHYVRCPECGHVFRTAAEFEREYNRIVDAWNAHRSPYLDQFWGRTRERLRHRRARDIDECPFCRAPIPYEGFL